MGARAIAVIVTLLLALVATAVAPIPAQAKKFQWSPRLGKCEPPAVFYSSNHTQGTPPCCPVVEGMCAGGAACPASGACPGDGKACVFTAIAPRPNVILFISDDQGYCDYGSAGECRSVQTGTPIPVPSTPNLDLLAGYGTIFPIAHNTASWCFPSLATIVTGRYQKSFGGKGKAGEKFVTIPKALHSLGGSGPADPYHSDSRIGGYCTFLGGKFTASTGDAGFDGLARGRKLGRTDCIPGPGSGPPLCGSQTSSVYSPATINNMGDLFGFLESMLIRLPGNGPAAYAMQHFFAWVAPRVPHQPLTAPAPIQTYLFGTLTPPALGGILDFGKYCNGASCPPMVDAFRESNFGNEYEYYANLFWVDDAVREVREYLVRAGAPHCIGGDGLGRYDVTDPSKCTGTWASSVSPDLPRNSVMIYMSDNGWFLPSSKHAFTENGYRTRMIVFDPRTLPTVPGYDGTKQTPPPPSEMLQVAHSSDVLPTALGYALGTPGSQACPVSSSDGNACDGKDLRPWVFPASTGGTPAAPLRHSLCGHHTQRPTSPTTQRYLLTRPGSVGRCTDLTALACGTDANCGAGAICLGGHCAASAEPACSGPAQCPSGAACLGGRCRVAPACIDDANCAAIFPSGHFACVEPETKWCRNAPDVRCGSNADCPVCAAGPGPTPPPCSRLCEARQLKLYITPALELTDLFLDPDEHGLHGGMQAEGTIANDLSRSSGGYAGTMSRLECCVDAWWPAGAIGSTCSGSCPADFVCNE